MFKMRILSVFIILISLSLWLACSESNKYTPVAPGEQNNSVENTAVLKNNMAFENDILIKIVKKLSKHLKNDDIRSLVIRAIADSKVREQVVFLEKMLDINNLKGTSAESLSLDMTVTNFLQNHEYGIDIYFPVEKHRKSMLANPNQNFYIAYVNGYADDQVEQQFQAWDLTGNEFVLSTSEIPSTPVLVVSQSEIRTNLVVTYQDPTGSVLLNWAVSTESESGGGGSNNALRLTHIDIHDRKEPWFSGDAEIYVKTKSTGYSWRTTHLYKVDNEQLYSYNPAKYIHPEYNWTVADLELEVWESDPGPDDDLEKHSWRESPDGSDHWDFRTAPSGRWQFGEHRNADVKTYYGE